MNKEVINKIKYYTPIVLASIIWIFIIIGIIYG